MFTGLIEETGTIHKLEQQGSNLIIQIQANTVVEDLKLGDSIAVDGVCQTVTEINKNIVTVCAIAQTLKLTNFNDYQINNLVNLERPLRLQDRLGGHLVQGHVDGIGRVTAITDADGSQNITIAIPDNLNKYIIAKGSIALNGISLTVAEKGNNSITVCIIPTTIAITNIHNWQVNNKINIEVDMMAKYLENLVTH